MHFDRYYKQANKIISMLLPGMRPTAVHGRFVGPKVLVNSIPKAGICFRSWCVSSH